MGKLVIERIDSGDLTVLCDFVHFRMSEAEALILLARLAEVLGERIEGPDHPGDETPPRPSDYLVLLPRYRRWQIGRYSGGQGGTWTHEGRTAAPLVWRELPALSRGGA